MTSRREALVFSGAVFVICIAFSLIVLLLYGIFNRMVSTGLQSFEVQVSGMQRASVVLDAGHGGRDGGAVSKDGILEKDLNLAVTNRLYDLLTLCGVHTAMTRTEDSLVCDENDPTLKGKIKMTDLKNRLAFAENYPDAVFVSIHMNNFPIEKYSGLQVYYSGNNEKSYLLAKTVQDNIRSILQINNDRKTKAAGRSIFLLERILAPAILVECGFLSNPAEAEKLEKAQYQTQVASVLAESILLNLDMRVE